MIFFLKYKYLWIHSSVTSVVQVSLPVLTVWPKGALIEDVEWYVSFLCLPLAQVKYNYLLLADLILIYLNLFCISAHPLSDKENRRYQLLYNNICVIAHSVAENVFLLLFVSLIWSFFVWCCIYCPIHLRPSILLVPQKAHLDYYVSFAFSRRA